MGAERAKGAGRALPAGSVRAERVRHQVRGDPARLTAIPAATRGTSRVSTREMPPMADPSTEEGYFGTPLVSMARRSSRTDARCGNSAKADAGPRRCGSWWPSPVWTATTAVPRWSPERCVTPAWRSSTRVCTRRPSRSCHCARRGRRRGRAVRAVRRPPDLFRRVVDLLAEAEASDIVVFGGGIIPEADRAVLAEMGVAHVFTPGSTMAEIVAWVRRTWRAAAGRRPRSGHPDASASTRLRPERQRRRPLPRPGRVARGGHGHGGQSGSVRVPGERRLRETRVPVLRGITAVTPEEASAAAAEIGSPVVVVKAQVKTGGRGKAGGVKVAKSPTEAAERAEDILGLDIKGHVVQDR